jgi:hypothetical protein
MNRIDLVFSYWIFIWYIFYILKIISYNPKFAIYCGIIENIIIIILMIVYKTKIEIIIYFVLMVILLKILPLYTIINTDISKKDIYSTIFLFIIYLLWIYVNNKSLLDFKNQIFDLILYNKYTFPGIYFFHKMKLL